MRLVREALEMGVRVFDTADAYGNGASERILGHALRYDRGHVVLATKGGYHFRERTSVEQAGRRAVGAARQLRQRRPAGAPSGAVTSAGASGGYVAQDFSPGHLRCAIEASLRRLRTDYIDVYQLHGPGPVHPDVFDELGDLVTAGKVLSFGIGAETVPAAHDWLAVPAVQVVQVPFGVLDPEVAEEVLPLATGRGIDVWARGVLAGGLLARTLHDERAVQADPKWPAINALLTIARRTGVPVDELAVGYVRSFVGVSTVLLGVSSSQHLARNVDLMRSAPLEPELVAELSTVRPPDLRGRL